MTRRTPPANVVQIAIAAILAVGCTANALSAIFTGEVWMVSARGFHVDRTARVQDPFDFWATLILMPALLAYFLWDIWRRRR